MSEWKWCLGCGHSYLDHRPTERQQYGPCTHPGCNCGGFEQEVANFL